MPGDRHETIRKIPRPLLPAPSAADRPQAPPNAAHSGSPRVSISKGKAVDTACELCRKRKSKCDGVRPQCGLCFKRGAACQYSDAPSSRVVKQKYSEVQQKLNAFETLLRFLRTKSDVEALGILNRIRNGHSVDATLRYIQDADLLLQLQVTPEVSYQYAFPYQRDMPAFLLRDDNPYLQSSLYNHLSFGLSREQRDSKENSSVTRGPYDMPFHAAEIVDPRLNNLDAKKWTTVIHSNTLLSKLLQIFFLTEYTWFPCFHKDYFLEDMAAGRTRFCSSLLVNAVLASACRGYSQITTRAEFWNPQCLGYQFFAEARRLWELEIGSSRLTTIQAAMMLSLGHDANGSDQIGRSYLAQAVQAAHAVQLFSDCGPDVDKDVQHVRAVTAWCLFGIQAVHCFHVFIPPLLNESPEVPLPDLAGNLNSFGEFWLKYPLNNSPIPVHYSATFKAQSDLRLIINDLALAYCHKMDNGSRHTLDKFQLCRSRLAKWYCHLSDEVAPNNICFPWQLKLHMHYWNLMIYVLETLRTNTVDGPQDDDAEKELHSAKLHFETLLRLYYLRHGFESYDIFLVHFLSFLGFMHLQSSGHCDASEADGSLSTILLIAKGLQEQGRNYYLARVIFRMTKNKLSAATQRLLTTIGAVDDKDGVHEEVMVEHIRSAWPIDIVGLTADLDKQRLDSLITAGTI